MAIKYFDGIITNKKVIEETLDNEFITKINKLDKKVEKAMDDLQVANAISEIFELLRSSNKYIDETTPWTLAKDDLKRERLETVLYNLLESIRVCAIFLEPFMPDTSKEILKQLNNFNKTVKYVDDNNYQVTSPSVLFMRIDKDKFFTE